MITPLAAMQLDEIEANRENFTATGIEAIRQGKVAAVLLAGGMGTRLGSDNPKGMYNVGLTHELYIFECLINNLLEVVHQADAWIHLFVMTSDKNNDATITFLQEHDYFGYKAEYVHFSSRRWRRLPITRVRFIWRRRASCPPLPTATAAGSFP